MDKTLFAQTGILRGKNKPGFFTYTFEHTPEDSFLRKSRGSVFVLAQIKSEDENKAIQSAQTLFNIFKDSFFKGIGSNLKVLEESLETVKEELSKNAWQSDFLVANLWGSVVYIGKIGDGSFMLARNEKGRKLEINKIASGALEEGDILLLATDEFADWFDLNEFALNSEDDFNQKISGYHGKESEKEGYSFCLQLTVSKPEESPSTASVAAVDKPKISSRDLKKEIDLVAEAPENLLEKLKKRAIVYWTLLKPNLRKIWHKLREFLRKVSILILAPWLPTTDNSEENRIARKRQRIAEIVVLLAIVFIVSILFGFIGRNFRSDGEKGNKTLSAIENSINDAKNLQNINPGESENLLNEASMKLAAFDEENSEVKKLQKQISDLLEEAKKIYEIKSTTVADFSSIKGGIKISQLVKSDQDLFVLDKATDSIYKSNLVSRDKKIILSEKQGLQNIAMTDSNLLVQEKSGIYIVDKDGSGDTNVTQDSPDWNNLVKADNYKDNLYLLDRGAKQIWKMIPEAETYSNPTGFLVDSYSENPISMAVDGAIYLATKTKIERFFSGKKDTFKVRDQSVPFSKIVDIHTEEGFVNLYVLDSGNGGVFVFEKSSGEYKGLYKNKNFENAKSIIADEKGKTILFIVGNEVRSIKLK